jgi:choline dehydrogenase-like flavoprotein
MEKALLGDASGPDIDVIVVGSGPGGATVARELARRGRRVVILERGLDWRRSRFYGTYLGALRYTDHHGLLFSREGLNIIRPFMVGGATTMFCACASPPPPWWYDRYGIELGVHTDAVARELDIAPLPAKLRGEASTRIAEAGVALGMAWDAQPKFMRPIHADGFDCGAHCMLGCRCGAKWSAAQYIDDAVNAGARLYTRARADRILSQDGEVQGVAGRLGRRRFRLRARTVVVGAGGIGSAELLRRSGFDAAGRGVAMDTTVMVYGSVEGHAGIGTDPPMTWSCADDGLGVLYSTLIDPWLTYPIIMSRQGVRAALSWPRWSRTLGVMIKLTDEVSGEIDAAGRIAKGLTSSDRRRLDEAKHTAARILARAGCSPSSILTGPLRGTHPSATVRIGDVLSTDLETPTSGLYVCDASVFPRALGRPTVLTIIGLARRLADRLAPRAEVGAGVRHPSPGPAESARTGGALSQQ